LYKKTLDAITNNCINGMPGDAELSSDLFQVVDIQDEPASAKGDNRKIFDTRDLSQVNLVYNDITLQVYPEPKEKSNGSGIWPRDE
jgi:hypothetical protein